MAIKEIKIVIKATEGDKEIDIYSCSWDGELGEWMEIGGEVAAAAVNYDNVVMHLRR